MNAHETSTSHTTIVNQSNITQQPKTEVYHNSHGEFVIPIGKCYCFICKTTIDPIDLITSSCIRKKEKETVINVTPSASPSDPQVNSSKEKRKRIDDNSWSRCNRMSYAHNLWLKSSWATKLFTTARLIISSVLKINNSTELFKGPTVRFPNNPSMKYVWRPILIFCCLTPLCMRRCVMTKNILFKTGREGLMWI